MVSLNDVLLAYSNIPVDDPIAEIWGRGLQGGYKIIEYTGTLPITIVTDGTALIDYCIYGNTVQDGTPTPEDPVNVVGCGERTENLCDISDFTETITNFNYQNHLLMENLPIGTYTLSYIIHRTISNPFYIMIGTGKNNFTQNIATKSDQVDGKIEITFSIEEQTNIYVRYERYLTAQTVTAEISNVMLNTGSTALPYEPYGYKLPMTVSDGNTVQTVHIYLGEVETTRRIKKLVLTGGETWRKHSDGNANYTFVHNIDGRSLRGLCSHYTIYASSQIDKIDGIYLTNTEAIIITDLRFTTVTDFKSYLAAQYAAGTPVTVWYVLANEETGIVNEPLMKIGGYADTVSMEQADVSIPTIAGTTIIDYDGTPKPSEMYIKYRR